MASSQFANPLSAGIDSIRNHSGWILTAGILLILLGAACIVSDVATTFATVLLFGWVLLFSGVIALVNAFRVKSWSGFFLYLLSALFRGFTGYLIIRYPIAGAVGATLALASFFIVGGLFRTVGATMMKLPRWGWSAFSGVVSVVLGIMLLAQMPLSSIWFIGFAIGIDLILEGASLIGFAAAIRSVPRSVTYLDRAA